MYFRDASDRRQVDAALLDFDSHRNGVQRKRHRVAQQPRLQGFAARELRQGQSASRRSHRSPLYIDAAVVVHDFESSKVCQRRPKPGTPDHRIESCFAVVTPPHAVRMKRAKGSREWRTPRVRASTTGGIITMSPKPPGKCSTGRPSCWERHRSVARSNSSQSSTSSGTKSGGLSVTHSVAATCDTSARICAPVFPLHDQDALAHNGCCADLLGRVQLRACEGSRPGYVGMCEWHRFPVALTAAWASHVSGPERTTSLSCDRSTDSTNAGRLTGNASRSS